MLKLLRRNAHLICWIVIGSLVQAQGFSTTVVKEGEDAIIDCGLQTEMESYLKWEAVTNDTTVVLALDIRDGHTDCNDRIINCTLYANGSIKLESVSKEDGASYYRCLRGDTHGYNYYSDHRLLVLSKEKTSSPPSIETPQRESVNSYNINKKGVLHGYNAPVCEDDVDGNLPVVCYPPSDVIVDREYETIQCNCTDSDGLMDSVTFPVTRQMSSPPSIETPHRESVSSYYIDKKGVLHGYNAPVCEDDVDGNLPVVCYPPSGIIVDREYETIQCNCTNSDGLMDNVTFPVTSVTHGYMCTGWRKAFISLLAISILLKPMNLVLVIILICCYLYKNHKKLKAYRAASSQESGLADSTNNTLQDTHSANEHVPEQPSDETITEANRNTKETTQVARTVPWDAKTVKPHADNGPKRPCKEYHIDEYEGERSFCFEFELEKPGVHLFLSTRREENSPSKYEIYFDEGKIRTSTEGKEGDSVLYDCGRFSMIMEGEELSLSILDEDEGWIPLVKWENQVYLNQCCFIAVFNMKFLQVEKCRRLTAFENLTSRTLSLHPKRK